MNNKADSLMERVASHQLTLQASMLGSFHGMPAMTQPLAVQTLQPASR